MLILHPHFGLLTCETNEQMRESSDQSVNLVLIQLNIYGKSYRTLVEKAVIKPERTGAFCSRRAENCGRLIKSNKKNTCLQWFPWRVWYKILGYRCFFCPCHFHKLHYLILCNIQCVIGHSGYQLSYSVVSYTILVIYFLKLKMFLIAKKNKSLLIIYWKILVLKDAIFFHQPIHCLFLELCILLNSSGKRYFLNLCGIWS